MVMLRVTNSMMKTNGKKKRGAAIGSACCVGGWWGGVVCVCARGWMDGRMDVVYVVGSCRCGFMSVCKQQLCVSEPDASTAMRV